MQNQSFTTAKDKTKLKFTLTSSLFTLKKGWFRTIPFVSELERPQLRLMQMAWALC